MAGVHEVSFIRIFRCPSLFLACCSELSLLWLGNYAWGSDDEDSSLIDEDDLSESEGGGFEELASSFQRATRPSSGLLTLNI